MTVRTVLGVGLLLWAAAGSAGASAERSPVAPVIGLMAAAEPEVTASLAAGARLALEAWARDSGLRLSLIVAEPSPAWEAVSGPAVEMAFDHRVVALMTPPDRATAHLLAQLGTRAHLPVVSTSRARSVTATGSFWVVSVVEEASEPDASEAFRAAYRTAVGREPDGWAVLGYDAASAIAAAVHRAGLVRHEVMDAWRTGLDVPGAAGSFGFDEAGRRRRAR